MVNLWEKWGIQLLVIGILFFQIILTLLGHHRKQIKGLTGIGLRCVLYATYSMTAVVIPYSLGKLLGQGFSLHYGPYYSGDLVSETKALLAPLLMLQLGYPDNITAYSMTDNQLGLKNVLNVAAVVTIVAGILFLLCYDVLPLLSFCLFLAGLIKYAEGIRAHKFTHRSNIGITSKEISEGRMVPLFLRRLPEEIHSLHLLVKAYYRFNCLKPHIEKWIYQPSYVSHPLLSIDNCSLKDAFIVTEMELGFMYDVLYTKALVIYSKLGFIVRLISFFSLVIAVREVRNFEKKVSHADPLIGLIVAPLIYAYINLIFSVLIVALLLELYQILVLPYSEWMIVKMAKRNHWPFVNWFLRKLVPCSVNKWRQWSDSLDQFNMLGYCLRGRKDWTRHIKFLKFRGFYVSIRRNWSLCRMGPVFLPTYLKERTVQELKYFEKVRGTDPFCERGKWTIERYGVADLEQSIRMAFERSIRVAFDKSIITWHLATSMCFHLSKDQPNASRLGSKLLSDYMMYLLVIHPDMLSSTGDIVFRHAHSEVKKILNESLLTEGELAQKILDSQGSPDDSTRDQQTEVITSGWSVITDAQSLARCLMGRSDRWDLITSMWMELLSYGASNCQLSHHADQLTKGGEFITLVWLLLAHKTDKFQLKRERKQDSAHGCDCIV